VPYAYGEQRRPASCLLRLLVIWLCCSDANGIHNFMHHNRMDMRESCVSGLLAVSSSLAHRDLDRLTAVQSTDRILQTRVGVSKCNERTAYIRSLYDLQNMQILSLAGDVKLAMPSRC
jgi:hypothetical protein